MQLLRSISLLVLGVSAELFPGTNYTAGDKFDTLTTRSGNINIHFHSLFVSPTTNNVYLVAEDDAYKGEFYFTSDKILMDTYGATAYVDVDGSLKFTNCSIPQGGITFGFALEPGYPNIGTPLSFNGNSPIAYPYQNQDAVFFEPRVGPDTNDGLGFTIFALGDFDRPRK
ncbi:hypothetical protein NEOLI_004789 [Neolecta irregularis DAH-3]|uniref:Cell wall protein RHD3 n=1 Tax=Neolecta irregularis (strain DAH-3) TaxID=1198029 RepID=A0A1U7LH54_NEOID|nr:hypothetical protein NEOLI_004789 [Neolecta irregularis DAH-3]|eukprot:OLL21958.1 hypothetical protein NEOLI_004789 [Neolecta irregularis DAH-3]